MKIFISADIEGVTGATHWDETDPQKPDYSEFRDQMTAEVAAACEAAYEAGATEVWVKDAHGPARNLKAAKLPQDIKLMRGWSGHPFGMVEGLDETFDALLLIGYHSRGGSSGSPLAHTITGKVSRLIINDLFASEFLLSLYSAALVGVPVVFVSGDEGLCEEAKALCTAITTVAVKRGIGDSTISLHPTLAVKLIKDGVKNALRGNIDECKVALPDQFSVALHFNNHQRAYRASFFPGAHLSAAETVHFESNEFFEVLRFLSFVLW
jgi:D-amino peptidase